MGLKMHRRQRHSYAANKPVCASLLAAKKLLQPWPKKGRHVRVAISKAPFT